PTLLVREFVLDGLPIHVTVVIGRASIALQRAVGDVENRRSRSGCADASDVVAANGLTFGGRATKRLSHFMVVIGRGREILVQLLLRARPCRPVLRLLIESLRPLKTERMRLPRLRPILYTHIDH